MDGFTYTDIFDTKGVEYLIIIGFLVLIIPFWILLNKPLQLKNTFRRAFGVLSESVLRIPQGLFYSKNHTWTQLEKTGYAKIGLDDLLMHITGPVEVTKYLPLGEKICKGDVIAEIDQDGRRLRIASPISGEVQSINVDLMKNTQLLNEDPYGKGWIYKIKPMQWVADTSSCYLAEEATKWTKQELARFKDFMAMTIQKHSQQTAIAMMQEGGELIDNPLSGMPGDVWKAFQTEFLDRIFEK